MAYQILANKYRPKFLEDVVGHAAVKTLLSNSLDNQSLHHAYLLTGTRGVGKTTLARILARSMNCLEGVSSNPCGLCDSCKDIDSGASIDVIEIDAASRTKVEDTRDLLSNLGLCPTYSKYKVYIIDEVHMLSTHSFNALLKAIEEPPAHVKFILATTALEKIPATIVSRCIHLHLKDLTSAQIALQLGKRYRQDQNLNWGAASGAAFEEDLASDAYKEAGSTLKKTRSAEK